VRALALAALAACGSSSPAAPSAPIHNAAPAAAAPGAGDVVARLERHGCYGECPTYHVTILGDGSVHYEGQDFVAVKGTRAGRADPDAVARLREAATRAGFAAMPDFTHQDCTDLPSAVVTIGGHTIRHYFGDRHAPESLIAIENLIDAAAKDTEWVGVEPGGPYGSTCF
jgi:hypothetical protein